MVLREWKVQIDGREFSGIVPCTVFSLLRGNGLPEELYRGTNERQAEAYFYAEPVFSAEFTADAATLAKKHAELRFVPITSHITFGHIVGATPNGRLAGTSLSDGASPSQGADFEGPTAVLLSSYHSKNYDKLHRASRLLNMKLSPKTVAGEAGTRKIMELIRTWCDLKLWHIQFNIINRETLLKAQQTPQDYRSLLVRVAGYSAYFCDLSPALQNDIIERTEFENA